jgi:hypothetical protein
LACAGYGEKKKNCGLLVEKDKLQCVGWWVCLNVVGVIHVYLGANLLLSILTCHSDPIFYSSYHDSTVHAHL